MVRSDNMAVDFTPSRGVYTELKPFRFWCQKVLPLVYDDSLSYYELLCKVVDFLNKTMEDVETLEEDVTGIYEAYNLLQQYVNDYFDNLDVQEEINNKLDQMAEDGSLSTVMLPLVRAEVTRWLGDNIEPTTPPVDASLSISGAAADAAVTGAIRTNGVIVKSAGEIVDANNLPTGLFKINTDELASWTHIPDATRGIIIDCWYFDANTCMQFAYEFAYNATPKQWYRKKSGGNWSNWISLVDSTLTVEGVSADAKAVGDLRDASLTAKSTGNITDANLLGVGIYKINTDELANWTNVPTSGRGIIIESWYLDANTCMQFAYDFAYNSTPKQWYRKKSGGNWSSWISLVDSTLSVEGVGADARAVGELRDASVSTKTVGNITDANLLGTGLFKINTDELANWSNVPTNDRGIIIESWYFDANTCTQRALSFAYNIYPTSWVRRKSGGTWGSWYKEEINSYVISTQSNTVLDANDFPAGSTFTTTSDTVKIANVPFTRVAVIIKTYAMFNNPNRRVQTCESWANNYTGIFAVRNNQGNSWGEWVYINDFAPNKRLGFTVITDSLGSGYIREEGATSATDFYELSWPAYLGRKFGVKYYISGAGGQSTTQWLNSSSYGYNGAFQRFPVTPVYFITLGTNDANQNIAEQTFKDNYVAIINAVKARQPNAIILCMRLWRTAEPFATYNTYIGDVLSNYTANDNVFEFNITQEINSNAGIVAHLVSGHYDAIGYGLIADVVYNKFIEFTNSYPAKFRTAFAQMITSAPNQADGFPYAY